jgi:diaminohydroxyphosphoribosylaminopyrimidine deaminase/5-amino-6-(5-phosphoribosylamino)uracil reductase
MKSRPEHYMRECLRLAAKGRGQVSPNPMVGAVLVRDNQVIARGWHKRFGEAHAEVNCLHNARGDLSRATMYVNLEPCSHTGKTPPCADLIVNSGVRRVVVAMQDPNPRVAGRGLARLRRAGVRVTLGVLEQDARDLNRAFVHHITHRRPYVHLKIAQSLDGFIASPNLRGRWISSGESRRRVHALRAHSDAILVGAGTVLADDPRLTVRHGPAANPAVVVLSGRRRVPGNARIFNGGRRVILLRQEGSGNPTTVRRLRSEGVTAVWIPGRQRRLPLRSVLRELYRYHIGSLLVEGGADVFGQFLREDLVDELTVFLAPRALGRGLPAFGVWNGPPRPTPWIFKQAVSVSVSGGDLMVHARRREE